MVESLILVGGLEPWNFMTFHILGMSSSQLTFTPFFRGVAKNHQPVLVGCFYQLLQDFASGILAEVVPRRTSVEIASVQCFERKNKALVGFKSKWQKKHQNDGIKIVWGFMMIMEKNCLFIGWFTEDGWWMVFLMVGNVIDMASWKIMAEKQNRWPWMGKSSN